MEEKKGDIIWRNKFKSDFSMGQYDFIRYNQLITLADFYAVQVSNGNPESIQNLFSMVRVIYLNFRPLVVNREDWEKSFDELKKMFSDWKKITGKQKFPITLAEKLLNFYGKLLELKQFIGLGIQVSKVESERKKLNRHFGLTDD